MVWFWVPPGFVAYTKDLECLIESHHLIHHLYAHDTQLINDVRIVESRVTIDCMQQCIEEIRDVPDSGR